LRKNLPTSTSPNAFSLVELSIVLVVLGLLVGGILTGRSLIRAAQLRSVTTEQQGLVVAVKSFREKYFYLPGDLPNATQFWGAKALPANGGACNVVKNLFSTASPTTCDGDGNGKIEASSASGMFEDLKLWTHLANAGLIPSYPYIASRDFPYSYCGGNVESGDFPRSCPKPRIGDGVPNSGWMIYYPNSVPDLSGSGLQLAFNLSFSSNVIGLWGGGTQPYFLTPVEVWNIDTKVDDGKPARGSVVLIGVVSVAACADTTDMNNLDANYYTSDANTRISRKLCGLGFMNQF
jgi:prepilin-type N-terminal cleavage/methylation domain-containing protein